ncbi:MAG: NADP-binding protein [Clostridiaceae bacterium]|nr:NADP-binding protein [Clostridiaceae bacterium]
MSNKVRVVICGLGSMGSGIAKMIINKQGFDIVGAIDMDKDKVGKTLSEVLNIDFNEDNHLIITNDYRKVIKKNFADVIILATSSFTKVVFPLIKLAAEAGMNVVTTAEEMSFPRALDKELSEEMDRIAKENNISILGTGVNPGFIMDYVVIMLTGVCESVESIKVSRINDLSCFGKAVMEEQGIGLKKEDFIKGVNDNTIAGHVGFIQSFGMMEEAFNIKFDKVTQEKEPIISNIQRSTSIASVKPGHVTGCRQLGHGYLGDKVFVDMEHPQQVRPDIENIDTGDYININGNPNLNVQIKPEIPGGIATIAICVNMIPHVINSSPGLKTMLDLPIPRVILGDVRDLIRK